MAFRSALVTVSSTAATPVLASPRFATLSGTLSDPIPVVILNTDAAITIYIGGSDVAAANGFPLVHGAQLQVSIEARTSGPYALAASGAPVLAVLATRQ